MGIINSLKCSKLDNWRAVNEVVALVQSIWPSGGSPWRLLWLAYAYAFEYDYAYAPLAHGRYWLKGFWPLQLLCLHLMGANLPSFPCGKVGQCALDWLVSVYCRWPLSWPFPGRNLIKGFGFKRPPFASLPLGGCQSFGQPHHVP